MRRCHWTGRTFLRLVSVTEDLGRPKANHGLGKRATARFSDSGMMIQDGIDFVCASAKKSRFIKNAQIQRTKTQSQKNATGTAKNSRAKGGETSGRIKGATEEKSGFE
jgi:hypothetical protein